MLPSPLSQISLLAIPDENIGGEVAIIEASAVMLQPLISVAWIV